MRRKRSLFVLVRVLRGTFSYFRYNLRIPSFSRKIFNGYDVYLMQPVIPEIEAIPKSLVYFQAQGLNESGTDVAGHFFKTRDLDIHGQGIDGRSVVRAHAKYKFIEMSVKAIEGLEDAFVKVL